MKKSLSFLLFAALLFSQLPAPSVHAADGDRIEISTATELCAFAENCALDTWSQGKTVVLTADIDLTGSGFSPVPTFGGTFDGSGKTISGLDVSGGTAYQGLFRYIQNTGVVRDLTVCGTVSLSGEADCAGGVVGSNAGVVLNCAFFGIVEAKTQVGGIAGVNEDSGSIYRCTAEGSVSGEEKTGGIAGVNSGTITLCTNHAFVNTRYREQETSTEEYFTNLTGVEALDTTFDTGGIVGYSDGILRRCTNDGNVGYPHLGYNVGGVVGRSSGYIERCSSTGLVQGRKDVGGIAGQIAPDVHLIFSPDTIDDLREALDSLDVLLNRTMDNAEESGANIFDRLDTIADYADDAGDSLETLSDILYDWADGSMENVNELLDRLAFSLDELSLIMDGADSILDGFADGMDELKNSLEILADAMDDADEGISSLSESFDRIREISDELHAAMQDVDRALAAIEDALVTKDAAALARGVEMLENGAAQLTESFSDFAGVLNEIIDSLARGEWSETDVQDNVLDCLQAIAERLLQTGTAFGEIGAGLVLILENSGIDWTQIQDGAGHIVNALDDFSDADALMDDMFEALSDSLDSLGDMMRGMESGLDALAGSMDTMERAFRDMGDMMDEIRVLFDDLSGREDIRFATPGDDFDAAEDGLSDALNGLNEEMELLRGELDSTGDTLSDDLRAVCDKIKAISDLLLDALEDMQDDNVEDLWDDVSEAEIDNITLGKAKDCTNSGSVEGDINVGGIAGAMAIEYDFDPEGDATEEGENSFNFVYETRAVLQDCVNRGAVTSRKNAAGGVVGRMDLGYVLGCENYGRVESTDGDYVGGVAGFSASVVRASYAKCFLAGGSYVGGITGYGSEIYQCAVMVAVERAEGYAGAVAGDWDKDSGALSQNRFVDNGLAGVDGISYADAAEPVDYAVLAAEEETPAAFATLSLIYVVDGQTIETVSFSYGDSLHDYIAPTPPTREGYYAVWVDTWIHPDEDTLTFDHVLKAVYYPYVTTLESVARRDAARAVWLAEGAFQGNALLEAEVLAQNDDIERWHITLSNSDGAESHTLRYALPDGWDDVSFVYTDINGNQSSNVSCTRDGRYLVFSVLGEDFVLEAAQQANVSLIWLLWLVLPAAVVAVCVILLRHRKRAKSESELERSR